MTTVTAIAVRSDRDISPRVGLLQGIIQSMTMAWRTVVQLRHNPGALGDLVIQPILFVLLFTYVFGGAIAGNTQDYLSFALPGIMVMNMLFITMYVGIGLNTDLAKGVFDRLRSLPIARWAPMAGKVLADQIKQAWSIFLLLAIGMALGFRIGTNVLSVLAAMALLLVFALAFSWATVFVGLMAKDAEHVQMYGYTVLLPLTFGSNVFVPTDTMPGWLQTFVTVNPITHLTDASRALLVGDASAGAPWPVASAGTSVTWSLVWAAIIVAIFAPSSVWAFKRKV